MKSFTTSIIVDGYWDTTFKNTLKVVCLLPTFLARIVARLVYII